MQNRTIYGVLAILAISIGIVACNTVKEEPNQPKKKAWTPEIDQPSELAQIMRSIHDEAKLRKSVLEQGQLDTNITDNLFRMITAKPTKPHMKGEGFEPYAKAFIGSYNTIASATEVGVQIEAHNNMVTSCIACHKQFCDGPISRIEKLYIQ
ncbi:MAG: hypothetical protein RL754_241 [Bacteroidota bacterium]|jgi:hypothetical protein